MCAWKQFVKVPGLEITKTCFRGNLLFVLCLYAQVVLAQREKKWQRTCSWESDEYHNEFGVIYVYFTSGMHFKENENVKILRMGDGWQKGTDSNAGLHVHVPHLTNTDCCTHSSQHAIVLLNSTAASKEPSQEDEDANADKDDGDGLTCGTCECHILIVHCERKGTSNNDTNSADLRVKKSDKIGDRHKCIIFFLLKEGFTIYKKVNFKWNRWLTLNTLTLRLHLKKFELWCLCCMVMFRWTNKQPRIQKFWNVCSHYQDIYDWISPLNKRSGLPFILTQQSMGRN